MVVLVNGDWSGWRNWFPCSVTCGNGTRSRLRTCSNPKPQYGGDYCSGENEQSEDCSSGVDCSGNLLSEDCSSGLDCSGHKLSEDWLLGVDYSGNE